MNQVRSFTIPRAVVSTLSFLKDINCQKKKGPIVGPHIPLMANIDWIAVVEDNWHPL
jgi:hypothetical protein